MTEKVILLLLLLHQKCMYTCMHVFMYVCMDQASRRNLLLVSVLIEIMHVLVLFSIVCKDGNQTYKSGENFIKDDCSENCTCSPVLLLDRRRRRAFEGIEKAVYSNCFPLCDASLLQTQCAVGFKVGEYQNEVNGTNCFCNRSRCVERK